MRECYNGKIFKIPLFTGRAETLFLPQKQEKEKGKKNWESLLKINMKSFFDENIRHNIDFKHQFKTKKWIECDHNDRFEENTQLKSGGYIIKLEKDRRIDDDQTSENTRVASHLRGSNSNISKLLLNIFTELIEVLKAIGRFFTKIKIRNTIRKDIGIN